MSEVITQEDAIVRKRKAHRKSRLGCGNCKIRSVKCDETKPACRRCQSSGYTCNYSCSAPTLQLNHTGVFKVDLGGSSSTNGKFPVLDIARMLREPNLLPSVPIPIVSPLDGSMGEYDLGPKDFAALARFQSRTAWTFGTTSKIGSASRSAYIKTVSGLAKEHPYLFHIFLALSYLHDSYLHSISSSTATVPSSHRSALAFHWYHGTAIFKKHLARPSPATTLTSSQRDALWVCASLLGVASFAHIDAPDPAAAWPLKKPEPALDLDWLKMGHGKRVVWAITDPTRPDSAFYNIFNETIIQNNFVDGKAPIEPGILPPLFDKVFELSAPNSCHDTNPYHIPSCVLSQLWNQTINGENTLRFLAFIGQINQQYRQLVEEKDPRAMLLLVYWHSMLVPYRAWWLRRRTVIEGVAICMYLEKHCANDGDMMELLQTPRARILEEFEKIE